MDHNLIILSFLFIVTVGLVAQENDDTLKEFTSGTDVVKAVSTKIESSCIFQDDKELLRRIAYVETTDGNDTFTSPDHKGIWKMSESMFQQSMAADKNILAKIQKIFQINWLKTTWQDIQKPLYAGLAVRLYLLVTARNIPIPRQVKKQAQYWKMYYNSKENEQIFMDKISNLEKGCSNGLADVVFLMDSSGSIGSSNFIKMKKFLKEVIAKLNVGPNENHTRVAVVSFGNNAIPEFYLNSYHTVEQYHRAIDAIKYLSEATYTNLALKYLVDEAFKPSLGARLENKGVPKLVITLTDGMSTLPRETLQEAKRAHDAGINMISIGIGSSVKDEELTAMASEPTCRHKFLLNEFSELDFIKDIIEKKSCEAPIIVTPEVHVIETILPPGGSRQCKIEVTINGTTITVYPTNKGSINLYLSRTVYPNPANFDKKLTADSKHPAVEFLPGSPDKVIATEYCLLEGDKELPVNIIFNLNKGNHDQCHVNPCQNGGKCKNVVDGKYECKCPLQFKGKNCEIGFNCQNNNPCTPENIAARLFYFPHGVKGKFVQCSRGGQCFEMNCLPGLSWNPTAKTCTLNNDQCKINPCQNGGKCKNDVNGNYECECILPFTGKNCGRANDQGFNCQNKHPCTPENIAARKFYFPHEVKGKYVQCSEWRQCFEMNCPPGLSWNPTAYTCT